jgi:hypothetical protein
MSPPVQYLQRLGSEKNRAVKSEEQLRSVFVTLSRKKKVATFFLSEAAFQDFILGTTAARGVRSSHKIFQSFFR